MYIPRFFYVMAICLLLFVGCNSKQNGQPIVDEGQSTTLVNDSKSFDTDEYHNELEIKANLNEYWIGDGKFENISSVGSDIKVKYPQICNYPIKETQDKINNAIYESVIISTGLTDWKSMPIKADISYEITFIDDNIFSILFSGYISNGSYTDFEYAMTFNLRSGQEVNIMSFFSEGEILDLIDNCLKTKKFTVYPDEFSSNDMIKKFFGDFFTSPSNHLNDFYISKNKIVLITSLAPTKDYMFLEIDLDNTPQLKTID